MRACRRIAIVVLLLATSPARAEAPDFDTQVAPILARRCLDCHSGAEPKGGLDLSGKSRAMAGGDNGEVIVPGRPEESPLWELVADGSMPPKTRLPADEQATLRAWIGAGARWGADPIDTFRATTDRRAGRDWWSLRPVVRPDVPPGVNPIDFFVRGGLTGAGLTPSPRADKRTLIRRLTFDLTGLPPTPEDVEAFVKDENPSASRRLVDRLLASPRYGPRWARPWLDLARYGESNGFEHDEFRPDAWRYRDWVVNALNADLPYDEFARLQIAGDVLHPDDPAAIEATGFLVAGAYDSVGQTQQSDAMRKVVRQDELEDVVGTVSQAFLGLTVHCARCHDHKFDPIRQVEYYRFAASLSGVRHGDRDLTALDPETRAAEARIDRRTARLAAIESTIPGNQAGPRPPAPLAAWDFTRGLDDRLGSLHASTRGPAVRSPSGLKFDGKTAFAGTVPLSRDLRARTLEAWVRLDDLTQRGGAVIGLQSPDGSAFDAIVFAELEPGRWMAGSESFARSKSFNAPAETEAASRPVQVAIVYADDGTIAAYRDGKPYGNAYRTSPPVTFRAGVAQVVFGLRHQPVGGNRMLAGTVVRARLYDRALTSSEVAASARVGGEIASVAAIEAALPADLRAEHVRLRLGNDADRAELATHVRRTYAVSPRPPEPSHLLTRGNPAQPAEVVSAGALGAVAAPAADFGLRPDAPEATRRIAVRLDGSPTRRIRSSPRVDRQPNLAGALRLGAHRNAERLRVQRRPSRLTPTCLDWLASEFVASGWRREGASPPHCEFVETYPPFVAYPNAEGDAYRRLQTVSYGGCPRADLRRRWSATRCWPSRATLTRRSEGPASASFRCDGRRGRSRISMSRSRRTAPNSPVGRFTGRGPVGFGAGSSTRSIAPTPRRPHPAAP